MRKNMKAKKLRTTARFHEWIFYGHRFTIRLPPRLCLVLFKVVAWFFYCNCSVKGAQNKRMSRTCLAQNRSTSSTTALCSARGFLAVSPMFNASFLTTSSHTFALVWAIESRRYSRRQRQQIRSQFQPALPVREFYCGKNFNFATCKWRYWVPL